MKMEHDSHVSGEYNPCVSGNITPVWVGIQQPTCTYNKSKNKTSDSLPNLAWDVGAKLLQGGEKPFELAQLARPARWG